MSGPTGHVTIGRIVIVSLDPRDGELAAIVVGVNPEGYGTINVRVLPDSEAPTFHASGLRFCDVPSVETWRWPPRG